MNWREAPPDAQFAVLGDPISHSLSPLMQNAALAGRGRYVALQVPAREIDMALDYLRALGYVGVNVTLPNKEEAYEWCSIVTGFAVETKSVNTIHLWEQHGISTDGEGFTATLKAPVHKVLILGAGGSARVIASALRFERIKVYAWARDLLKARAVSDFLLEKPVAKGFDVVVNATSAGFRGEAVEVDWRGFSGLAYDISYGPVARPFLDCAREAGVRTMDGIAMLAAQGALALAFWFQDLDPDQVRKTMLLSLKAREPNPDSIREAADAILRGDLVVTPTETVYGLAANAHDESALKAIFKAKGRPAKNPLIVHVGSIAQARETVQNWPAVAQKLAEAFWPGPLTLVLPKADHINGLTTGGLNTVAVRMPQHPIALALIEETGVPLAAPSANLFTELSPTRPDHLGVEILEAAEMVLDGGPCEVGIESTVLDLTGSTPTILRQGHITREQIEGVLGLVISEVSDSSKSPGQHPRHYSPKAQIRLVKAIGDSAAGLTFGKPLNPNQITMPSAASSFASKLYGALHELDQRGVEVIEVEEPPIEWVAVWDRLRRAAHQG